MIKWWFQALEEDMWMIWREYEQKRSEDWRSISEEGFSFLHWRLHWRQHWLQHGLQHWQCRRQCRRQKKWAEAKKLKFQFSTGPSTAVLVPVLTTSVLHIINTRLLFYFKHPRFILKRSKALREKSFEHEEGNCPSIIGDHKKKFQGVLFISLWIPFTSLDLLCLL